VWLEEEGRQKFVTSERPLFAAKKELGLVYFGGREMFPPGEGRKVVGKVGGARVYMTFRCKKGGGDVCRTNCCQSPWRKI